MCKNKKDDRRDNESKLKRAISATESRKQAAEEMMAVTNDPKTIAELKAKNQKRNKALHSMNIEMKQEAEFNKFNNQK